MAKYIVKYMVKYMVDRFFTLSSNLKNRATIIYMDFDDEIHDEAPMKHYIYLIDNGHKKKIDRVC